MIYTLFLSVWSELKESPLWGKKEEVSLCVLLTLLLREGTGAGTIWAVYIYQLVTEWSLPDHFSQVTNHLVLTASDHAILSKIWMDSPEVLCNDYLQKEDWIKTKHGLKSEEVKL